MCMKCTNTDLLKTASNLMPRAIERKLDMMQYAGRFLAIENNPIGKLILDFYPSQSYLKQRKPLPIVAGVHYEMKARSLEGASSIA